MWISWNSCRHHGFVKNTLIKGANVVATDMDKILDHLKQNINPWQEKGLQITCQTLDWRHPSLFQQKTKFDFILGAGWRLGFSNRK